MIAWLETIHEYTELHSWRPLVRIAIKLVVCITALNLVYALLQPLSWLDNLTLYNHVAPGRIRFPYQEEINPRSATVTRMNALFADHEISGATKTDDEYRVIILGGSSLWGLYLDNDQTLAGCMNQRQFFTADGRHVRVFNLAY